MTIPTITATHVIAAIHEIDRDGVPDGRRARGYRLVHEKRSYPPKYVVSLAAKYATGIELPSELFSGGKETNSLLTRLGFLIESSQSSNPSLLSSGGPWSPHTPKGPVAPKGPNCVPIARIVVRGAAATVHRAETLLFQALTTRWPSGTCVKFLITPGGFIQAQLPDEWQGGVSWDSTTRDFKKLCTHAESKLSQLLTKRVLRAARGKTEVLTIGVDLYDPMYSAHAELVAVFEVGSEKLRWTGKSYPVIAQEHDLIQVTDLQTHLMRLAGERVLVLGCHDLNMFSARTLKNCNEGSDRYIRCCDMVRHAAQFNPTVVLQHPHSTDSPRIWSTAWSGIRSHFPDLKAWASGIGYVKPREARAPLEKVLSATRSDAGVVDIVVSANAKWDN